MDWGNLILLFFVISSLIPMIKQRAIETERIRLIRSIEKKRGSRVITMIHRQESMSLLGIPISRYINIEDSEHVLRAIRLTPLNCPLILFYIRREGWFWLPNKLPMPCSVIPPK